MTTPTKSLVKELARPSDFVELAEEKGAHIRKGHGSRVVIEHNGRTVGISDHGNKPYSKQYRYLVIRAFRAAGLLALLAAVWQVYRA